MRKPHHVSSREIERKFLIEQLPVEVLRSRLFRLVQGYLANESGGRHVRLRNRGKTASLTFKVGRGSSREEREIRLSPQQFATLWPATAGRRLRKVRYEIPWKKLTIEADFYRGRIDVWIVAKVKSPSLARCRNFHFRNDKTIIAPVINVDL